MNERKKPILIVVRDELTNPPSEPTIFRDLTLYQVAWFKDEIVIETDEPDIYSKWLRPYGCLDFVKDLVAVGTENRGLRVDSQHRGHITVVVDRIIAINLWTILQMIESKRRYL